MLIDKNKIDLRKGEDGIWIASCHFLPGCHASGNSEYEAIPNFQETAKAHLIALKDSGRPIPEVFRENFVFVA
jgi:predicted RNase H-like HicB family nuclease